MTPYWTLPTTKPAWRWWRGPLTALLALSVFSLLLLLTNVLPVLFQWTPHGSGKQQMALSVALNFVGVALAFPAALLVGRQVLNLSAGEQLTARGHPRWRLLGAAVLIGAVCLLPAVAYGHFTQPRPLSFGEYAPLMLLVAVLVLPVQCAAEELVFRGLTMQGLLSWWGTAPLARVVAALLSAALFTLVHGTQDVPLSVTRFGMALILSFLAFRTQGLEASMGLHTATNFLGLIVGVLTGSLFETVYRSGTAWPAALLQLAFSALGTAVILHWFHRNQAHPTEAPPSAAPRSPGGPSPR